MAQFPVHYRPRPYQAEAHAMWQAKRVGVVVYPRQTGKDVAMSIEECQSALKTPKTTGVYVSLNNPMIRDILWDKTYLDPVSGQYVRMLQDNVPAELCSWQATSMTGSFSNKSRLKLQGYFQSGQDRNGVGTSFQRYNFTELALFTREDPLPRLMPIIQNEAEPKKLRVASTPRGKRRNPLWQLMQSMEGNSEYGIIIRTIDDINEMMRRAGEPPVLTQERLDQIRDAYLKRFGNDRMFEQEYYCSFEEMDAAAVYGEAYSKLLEEKRNTEFNIDPGHPLYVAFDIGSLNTLLLLASTATRGNTRRSMSAGVVLIAFSWCSASHGRMISCSRLNQGFTRSTSTYSGSALPWPSPQSYRNSLPLNHWNAIHAVASEWMPELPMSNATYSG